MLKKLLFSLLVLTMVFLSVPQFTKAETLTWEPMVNSTFTGNRAPGFGDNNNILPVSMVTYNNYVYISNYNNSTGTEIWRSSNGSDWEKVNDDGFGVTGGSFAILEVLGNNLFAFNWFTLEGHVDVYRYNDGISWTNTATIGNMSDPICATVYNNVLYVCLSTGGGTSAIYSSPDGTTWSASNNDGFGDANNNIVQSLEVYNNRLYAGTYNDVTGTEIWYFNGSTWTRDNSDGFGTALNVTTGTLTNFNGQLYASTFNGTTGAEVWRSSGGGIADWTKVADAGFGQGSSTNFTFGSTVFKNKLYIGAGAASAKIFRTSDGINYEQVNIDGFGYDDNDMVIFSVLGDYLYAGTGNLSVPRIGGPNTTEVYRYYEADPVVEALPATGSAYLEKYIFDAII